VHTLDLTISTIDSVTSSITACDSYDWNGQIIDSSGSYIQTLTNVNSCDSVHTLVVDIFYSDSTFQTLSICYGDSILVGDSVYLNTGMYYNVFVKSNGCDSIVETNLIVNTLPEILLDSISPIDCYGLFVGYIYIDVSSGTPGYDYMWDNGDTTQDLTNVPLGTYQLVVTDAIGCENTASYTLSSGSSSLVTISNIVNVSCYGNNDGQISVLANGGVAPYVVTWPTWTGQTIFNLYSGDYPYTVTDALGCMITDTVTVTEPTELTIDSVIINNISCNGLSDGYASFIVNGGTLPYMIDWGGVNPNSLNAGTYSVLIVDDNGCLVTESLSITEPSIITSINTIQNLTCNNGNDGVVDMTVSGGVSPYSYFWNNGMITEDISNLSAGYYNVTILDSNNCMLQNVAYVSEPNPIINNISMTVCEEDEFTIGGSVLIASMALNGNNTFTLTSANGCDSTLQVLFTVYPKPLVPVITQIFAATFEVLNGPFDTYQWYINSDTITGETNSTLNFYQSAMYTVEVSNSYGCTSISLGFPIGVSGINEEDLNEFKLYPNPTRDFMHLEIPKYLGFNCVIELYDSRGRELDRINVQELQSNQITIDLTGFSNGIYQMVVRYSNGDVWNQKVIKQ
jgi:hypothetical protein